MSDGPTRAGATRAAQGTQGTTVVEAPATAPTRSRLPPGPRLPKLVQGIGYAVSRNLDLPAASPAATATCSQ